MSGGATRFLTLLNTTNSFPLLLLHHQRHRLLLLRHQHKLLSHFHYHPLTLSPSSPIKQQQLHTRSAALRTDHSPPSSHPWPEWSTLLHHLSLSHSSGYGFSAEDEFVAPGGLPDDLVRAATACLAFARQNPNILGYVLLILFSSSFSLIVDLYFALACSVCFPEGILRWWLKMGRHFCSRMVRSQ